MSDQLFVVVGIDVEEEGLFGGRYACRRPSVRNTARLSLLRPLMERGVRPTLFCAYSALVDEPSREILAALQADGAEIGAHLHHWNTPPLELQSIPGDLSVSVYHQWQKKGTQFSGKCSFLTLI